jgi:hypothetical protein
MELYHIHKAHRSLISEIEANEGELTPELETSLKSLQIGLNDNLASLAYTVKEYNDKALLVANEIKRLQGLEKSHKNNAEYFKQYIDTVMKETGLTKLEQNNIRLSYRKSTAVEVFDVERIEARYMVVKSEPNKTLIKAAIEAGELVAGAELVERQNLQIK